MYCIVILTANTYCF